eukprot:3343070-Pyramimonas_sp.AAC.1
MPAMQWRRRRGESRVPHRAASSLYRRRGTILRPHQLQPHLVGLHQRGCPIPQRRLDPQGLGSPGVAPSLRSCGSPPEWCPAPIKQNLASPGTRRARICRFCCCCAPRAVHLSSVPKQIETRPRPPCTFGLLEETLLQVHPSCPVQRPSRYLRAAQGSVPASSLRRHQEAHLQVPSGCPGKRPARYSRPRPRTRHMFRPL